MISPEITAVHPEIIVTHISDKKTIPDIARQLKTTIETILDEEEYKNRTLNPIYDDEPFTLIDFLHTLEQDEVWINTKTNVAMQLAIKENEKKEEIPVTELVPEEYHDYLNVFDEEQANRYPPSRPWDHKIEMKGGFEPKSFKIYNLTGKEQLELDNFLAENLKKGYIRPSQSPMASPFFFVDKKDGKLRPCQDYRYLNDWTIIYMDDILIFADTLEKLERRTKIV